METTLEEEEGKQTIEQTRVIGHLCEKKTFIQLILCFSISLVSWSVDAHQPVLNSKSVNTAKVPYIIEEPEISKVIFPNSRGSFITTALTAIRNSNFTQVLQCPKSMTVHLQKSFLSDSLIPTSDLLNGKMVKILTGGHGMKIMEKNGTGSEQKLGRNLNPTEFTRRGLTTFEFSTDLTPVDTYWQ